MGRGGWSKIEVPDGWLQVIRGPKPPSVHWPSKKPTEQPMRGPGPSARRDPLPPMKEPQNWRPAEVPAKASSKVGRIQATIANLAINDIEEKATLEAALVRAQRQASVPPVDKRIADSMAFIERAKKRVAAESARILEAEKRGGSTRTNWSTPRRSCRRLARRTRGRRLALSRSIQWQSSKRSCRGSEHNWSNCRVAVQTQKFHLDPTRNAHVCRDKGEWGFRQCPLWFPQR